MCARARACVRACVHYVHKSANARHQRYTRTGTNIPKESPAFSAHTHCLHSVPTRIVFIQCPHVLSAFSAQHVLSVTSVRNSATTQAWKCHPPVRHDTHSTGHGSACTKHSQNGLAGQTRPSLDRQTGLPWTDRQGLPGQADTASLNRYGLS